MSRWQPEIVDVVASHFDGDALPLSAILDVLNPIEREQIDIENVAKLDPSTFRRAKYHEDVILRASCACRE